MKNDEKIFFYGYMINMIVVLCQVRKRRKNLRYSDLVKGTSIRIMNNVRGSHFLPH